MVRVTPELFSETFAQLRSCGDGRRECQALWLSSWSTPDVIVRVVHPSHDATPAGFRLHDAWLSVFWNELADRGEGVRVQVHTHPGAAYHSATDDRFPLLTTPGFLSLVIPRFAMGKVALRDAFLAELGRDGAWRETDIATRLEIA